MRNGGLITNLPADACVELACVAYADGVRPVRYGALPPACAALNEIQITVQRLIAKAAMTGSRELVHAAVALDPLTGALQTLPKIHEMTERMLHLREREVMPRGGLMEWRRTTRLRRTSMPRSRNPVTLAGG